MLWSYGEVKVVTVAAADDSEDKVELSSLSEAETSISPVSIFTTVDIEGLSFGASYYVQRDQLLETYKPPQRQNLRSMPFPSIRPTLCVHGVPRSTTTEQQ
ncbi:hypothetical protein TorRG33x02_233070, partial [Trema orientale]